MTDPNDSAFRKAPSARAPFRGLPTSDVILEISKIIDKVDALRDELVELKEKERRRI